MDVGKRLVNKWLLVAISVCLGACGGGSSGSDDESVADDSTEDQIELDHEELGMDVLQRLSAKSVDPSLESDAEEDDFFPDSEQDFDTLALNGEIEQACETGSIGLGYDAESTSNPITVNLSIEIDADQCFATLEDEGDDSDSVISTLIDGVFAMGVSAELSGSTAEDIALESLSFTLDVDPESSETVTIGDVEISALINEYSLEFDLSEASLVLNGIEDVSTSIEIEGVEQHFEQVFMYEALTFSNGDFDENCPTSGVVSGSINGTSFDVSFANDMIEVNISGEGVQNYTCEALVDLLEDNLQASEENDETESADELMDRAYEKAAYGSAIGFAGNMMASQGIIF